jgi:hypothetical protein
LVGIEEKYLFSAFSSERLLSKVLVVSPKMTISLIDGSGRSKGLVPSLICSFNSIPDTKSSTNDTSCPISLRMGKKASTTESISPWAIQSKGISVEVSALS